MRIPAAVGTSHVHGSCKATPLFEDLPLNPHLSSTENHDACGHLACNLLSYRVWGEPATEAWNLLLMENVGCPVVKSSTASRHTLRCSAPLEEAALE